MPGIGRNLYPQVQLKAMVQQQYPTTLGLKRATSIFPGDAMDNFSHWTWSFYQCKHLHRLHQLSLQRTKLIPGIAAWDIRTSAVSRRYETNLTLEFHSKETIRLARPAL